MGGLRCKNALAAIVITSAGVLGGCASSPVVTEPPASASATVTKSQTSPPRTHAGLNSTLWTQNAVEARASAIQAYRLASLQLDVALKNKAWTASLEQASRPSKEWVNLPPAVVLDIDETVLDNSPMQARLVRRGIDYDELVWSQWVFEAKAEAIPGAVEFVQYARKKGVRVFFISNRKRNEESYTAKNLQRVGLLPQPRDEWVLSRYEKAAWRSDKSSRRRFIADKHRVLLLIGDDFNDFMSGTKVSTTERRHLMARHANYWGRKWIVLSNPMYGSWEGALLEFDYAQSEEEKMKDKYSSLRPRDK